MLKKPPTPITYSNKEGRNNKSDKDQLRGIYGKSESIVC